MRALIASGRLITGESQRMPRDEKTLKYRDPRRSINPIDSDRSRGENVRPREVVIYYLTFDMQMCICAYRFLRFLLLRDKCFANARLVSAIS